MQTRDFYQKRASELTTLAEQARFGAIWRRLFVCLPTERRRADAILKGPAFRTGPDDLAIYFDVNAGAPFSPDFHTGFAHPPTLLDCHIGLADAPPDCHVGGTGAVFAA